MQKARNKEKKCPLVFVLDTSGSMTGVPINELNKTLIQIKEVILNDLILSNRLEVGIVAFDDDARVVREIDLLYPETEFPILELGELSNLVAGMNKAIELISNRKNFYISNVEEYYRPIIILFSGGTQTNRPEEIEELDQTIQKLYDEKRIKFLPFGIEGADMQILAKLTGQTENAWSLKDTCISELIKSLSVELMIQSELDVDINYIQKPTSFDTSITFDLSE